MNQKKTKSVKPGVVNMSFMSKNESESIERNFSRNVLSKMLNKKELIENFLELVDQQKEDQELYISVFKDHGILIDIKNDLDNGLLRKTMHIEYANTRIKSFFERET